MQKPSVRKQRPASLDSLRSRIDQVDEGLVNLMAIRQRLAAEALSIKKAQGIPLEDLAREAAVVRRASSLAREQGLDPEVTRDVFWRLMSLSRSPRSSGGRAVTGGGGATERPPSSGERR